MTSRDWTLLAIASATPQAVQPVQLQKSLFLLGRNLSPAQLGVAQFYEFAAYDYGPFCSSIYQDAEQLEREGLVTIRRPPLTRFNQYSATAEGMLRAEALRANAPKRASKYLEAVVTWVQALSFDQLVSAIYTAYPDMKENSVFHR